MPYSTPGVGPHFHFHRDEDSSDSEDGALNPSHHDSSLKSSSSAPHMRTHRLRTRPASSPVSGSSSPSTSSPKLVHFPAPDAGLEKVRVFRRRARPTSVFVPMADQTETETETETDKNLPLRWDGAFATMFPRSPTRLAPRTLGAEWGYALYTPDVPRRRPGQHDAAREMWLTGVGAHPPSGLSPWTPPDATLTSTQTDADGSLALVGTLLARNVAFEKHVSIHFTLDGWSTTSDVYARTSMPLCTLPRSPSATKPSPGWDRFTFRMPLAGYSKDAETGGLSARELVLTVHFATLYVRADGVAPYVRLVWSVMPSPLPCTFTDTIPQAAGQGWTGAGAGGAGSGGITTAGGTTAWASAGCIGRSKTIIPDIRAPIPHTAGIMAAARAQRVSATAR
ncbi:hypothetical protein B0H13DRAFT_2669598 [Mycena leptocephala]|nr:hypothetical protein B0H13DRAFT_2669598 [Mycena leptocephala]